MLYENDYPVLEFDTDKQGKLTPEHFAKKKFDTDKLVITFFPDVIRRLIEEEKIELERVHPGENPIEIYRFTDQRDVLITLGHIGSPACGGNLDLFQAMGAKKVMFCGGGGVLDKDIGVGQLLVVEGSIRDEGFSYHYIAPSRVIYSDPAVVERITGYLDQSGIGYLRGLTWTTDALFRETEDRIVRRRGEGAKIVEMEQSACIAVAKFRGFDYGAIIYGGDDVSQKEWANRGWNRKEGIRYNLVQLCRELVQII